MIKSIVFALIAVIATVFHTNIEQFIWNAGGSWTLSKLLPYILCWIFALLSFIFIVKSVSKKWLGIIVASIIFFGVVGVDFFLYPIYQGDFSNNGKTIQTNYAQFENGTLTVLAIPGCPFCHNSVGMLKAIKRRTPKSKIEFLVCSSDSADLKDYSQLIEGKFDLALINDLHILDSIGVMGFPTFIYTDNQGRKQLWRNDDFGAPAKDYIEKQYQ